MHDGTGARGGVRSRRVRGERPCRGLGLGRGPPPTCAGRSWLRHAAFSHLQIAIVTPQVYKPEASLTLPSPPLA